MAGIAAGDVIAVWERLNLVDLSGDHRRTLADHPDTHALTRMPYAVVVEAAHMAREDNHHGQLRLREWLNHAVSLAATGPDSSPPGPRQTSDPVRQ